MLSVTVDSGRLSGFSMGFRLPMANVSHSMFADDTLVFCEANPSHLRYLRVLLLCFEDVYGLNVNLAKSLLVPIGNMDNAAALAAILGCGTSSLPLKHLGMPLGACYKAKSIWDGILVKMERRLASWKGFYMSKGGRVTLIKSTLSNLPTCLSFSFLLVWPITLRSSK
jgi:hypothetical protein